MASTDAANQAILARIAGMTSHHPAQANLFSDWTLEPGDIVTVSSDGTDYSVPVFSMDFTWRGDREESEVSISATGGQKRDPPSALRRRSYGVARQQLTLEEALAAEFRRAGIKESEINTLAKAADDKVSLIVGGTSGSYTVDAAAIVNAINGQNTSGAISTAKVKISDVSGDTLDKKITNLDAGMSVAVTGFGTATASGGTVTIPYYTNGSPSPTAAGNITFDLTTMQYYQDAIVVTVGQSWATVDSSQIGVSNVLTANASSAGGGSDSDSKTLTLTLDSGMVNLREGSGASDPIRAKIPVPTLRTAASLTTTAVNSSSFTTTVTYDDGTTTTDILHNFTASVVFSGGSATARLTSGGLTGNVKTESIGVSGSVNSCTQAQYNAATNVLATAGIHTGTYYLAKVTVAGKTYNIKLYGS